MTITACPPLPGAGMVGGDDTPRAPFGAGRGPALHQYRTPFRDRPERKGRAGAPAGGVPDRPKTDSGGLALGRKRLTAQVLDGLFLLRVPVVRQATVDRHVRLDPLAMPFLPRRGQVLAGGQIEAVAVLERQEPANRPITPSALPENRRAEVVTQAGRQDLADPGGPRIGQYRHPTAPREAAPVGLEGPVPLVSVGHGDDAAFGHEQAGGADPLRQGVRGTPPEVEEQARGSPLLQRRDRLVQPPGVTLAKTGDLHHADVTRLEDGGT